MSNLLVATPNYLLRYDTTQRQTFVVESKHPEYYGISWFAGDNRLCLSHSGLDNGSLSSTSSYALSEVGYLSVAQNHSWQCLSAPHQLLCLDDGTVAVTNTGRNCLTIIRPDSWFIRHHRVGGSLWDRLSQADVGGYHLNSLTRNGEFLYVLAHNFDKGSFTLKVSCVDFHVIDILSHQSTGVHNLWFLSEKVLVGCDTMQNSLVNLLDGTTLWRSSDPTGMTRGLAATKDMIFVGASTNGARRERRYGETGIWALDAGSFRTADYHALGHLGGVHEVRVMDELDLCHPQGPLEFTPYLAGTPLGSFLSQRKLHAETVRQALEARWRIVAGSLTESDGLLACSGEEQCLAVLRDSECADFRLSGVLDVSQPDAQTCALVGRYSGPADTNMVAAILSREATGRCVIGIWQEAGAGWICLASRVVARACSAVEFSADGPRLMVAYDGTSRLEVNTNPVATVGAVGLRGVKSTLRNACFHKPS